MDFETMATSEMMEELGLKAKNECIVCLSSLGLQEVEDGDIMCAKCAKGMKALNKDHMDELDDLEAVLGDG